MILFVLSGLLLLIVLLVVAYPLVALPLEPYAPGAAPDAAELERDSVLEGLQDLDSAFLAGKLSEADYRWQKAALERDYARVLADLNGPEAASGRPTTPAATAPSAAE